MSDYTPVPTALPTTITIPDDGVTPRAASSVNVPVETALDAIALLEDGGPYVHVEDIRLPFAPLNLAPAAWIATLEGLVDQVNTLNLQYLSADFPDEAEVQVVSVHFKPPGGHAAFPGGAPTYPNVSLWKINTQGGTSTQIGSTAVDATTPVGTYEAVHSVSVTGLTEDVNKALYRYVIQFRSEGGANGIAGLELYGATWTGDVLARDLGGA